MKWVKDIAVKSFPQSTPLQTFHLAGGTKRRHSALPAAAMAKQAEVVPAQGILNWVQQCKFGGHAGRARSVQHTVQHTVQHASTTQGTHTPPHCAIHCATYCVTHCATHKQNILQHTLQDNATQDLISLTVIRQPDYVCHTCWLCCRVCCKVCF